MEERGGGEKVKAERMEGEDKSAARG